MLNFEDAAELEIGAWPYPVKDVNLNVRDSALVRSRPDDGVASSGRRLHSAAIIQFFHVRVLCRYQRIVDMLVLNSRHVTDLFCIYGLDRFMDRVIEELGAAFRAYSPDTTIMPRREGFADDRLIEWMPVSFVNDTVILKTVSYFPDNPSATGLPTVQSFTSGSSWRDGRLNVIAESSLLTAVRTGAASAVAARVLAQSGSRCLGLVGCGVQAVTQAHAISRHFPISQILVYDVSGSALSSIHDRLSFLGLPVQAVPLARLEEQCDIICTATSTAPGSSPVLDGSRLMPHVHINAVGSDYPGKIELPKIVTQHAFITPDHQRQAVVEGECQAVDPGKIGPELHLLVKDCARYEGLRDKTTIFDSTGIALEDAVILKLAVELAQSFGIGQEVEFYQSITEPRDPYAALRLKARTLPHAIADAS